jgi:hypothetical protein
MRWREEISRMGENKSCLQNFSYNLRRVKKKFGNTDVEMKQPQLQYVEFLDYNAVSLNM